MNSDQIISRLMAAKILGQTLTGEEEKMLEAWTNASPENKRLFERVTGMQDTRRIMELEREKYGEKMAARVMETISKRKSRLLKRFVYAWVGSAAAVILVCVVAFSLLKGGDIVNSEKIVLSEMTIVPGEVKAMLTFANGQTINITDTIKKVDLSDNLSEGGEEAYHTLTVPAGGEFFYELADGTHVWLNSESEIRFPAAFSGNVRQVFVKGEAFFDVVKDASKPFIVSLSRGDITVYGTRFNVNDYENADLSTVLVEGSIGFKANGGESVRLKPSDRLVYGAKTGVISVEKVDTMLYTAWVDKMFIFCGQPLGEVMMTLSRWYDFNISFESEDIKHIRLSGRLNRYQDIRVLLNTYEEVAGIKFKIEGKNIVISKKQ